ncbi:MAG: CoF synthetase [Verrucomicrobia bacterium RIFCSPLOWO2_12_FULL_64_8]|nr:MAG: CoF synthetase [Verrucomicrobia bacterium RIFCSPLOWO2_12_FULL_64_8]
MSAPVFANAPEALGSASDSRLPGSLESEIRFIYAHSPLYAQRFPLHAEPLRWACYREIPVLTKQEILDRGPAAFFTDYGAVERGLRNREFEYEHTSGSTARPMTVIMEDGWWAAQTRRAYQAHPLLVPYAGRAARKAVLAPVACSSNLCPYEDQPFPHRYFDGTVYLNLTSDPFAFPESEWDRIVLELQAVKPEILEGEPVYLSLLARAVSRRKVSLPSLQVVILTYGKASLQHGRRLAEWLPAVQVDLYGSTEAGYIFVGDAFQDNSRVIDTNVFVELEPWHGLPEVFETRITTRDRRAMPLLRYHTGDIVRRRPAGFRILGRERDLYVRPDGTLVSTGDIDAALPANFACWHYCLVQTAENRWDFHYVADHHAVPGLEAAIAAVLGAGTRVNAFRRRFLPPAASGKFSLLKPLAG